ncbi:MAG: tRNA (adenosine(37)-N6)-threonylcarbamoyltransferase complex dimerization subunit type 1 TsaB [Acidobacteriota bacterium]
MPRVVTSRSMLILAVDTSTQSGSVALARDGEILALAGNPGESHSLWLLRSVDRLLKEAGVAASSVEGYGIVIGPGSFTGLRIGIATVKGLAAAGRKPCAPVVSLDAMARGMAALRPGKLLAPAVDAKKGEVYFALYASSGGAIRRTHEPAAASPVELLRLASGGVIAGTGSDLCARTRGPADEVEFISIPPIAPEVVRIAHEILVSGCGVTPEQLEPLYLRKSEAEIQARTEH